MAGKRSSFIVALLVVLLVLAAPSAGAGEEPGDGGAGTTEQPDDPAGPEQPGAGDDSAEPVAEDRYFAETGFWVPAAFVEFWEANGGLMTFGLPISRVFYQGGLHRQYFERAIFEHHPHLASAGWETQVVRIGALNTAHRVSEPSFQRRIGPGEGGESGDARAEGESDEVFFEATGQGLRGVFYEYWSERGGMPAFGYPISAELVEPSREDGLPRLVQYFERARFEHHPQHAGTDFEVLLGHLGREALAARDVPPLAVTPQRPDELGRVEAPLGPLPVGEVTPVGCGLNMAYFADAGREVLNARFVEQAVESGCEWVRLQFSWADLEQFPGQPLAERSWPYDRIVWRVNASGLRLLVNVTHPPRWAAPEAPGPPADPQAFAAFMGRLAERYAGRVDAWQVWNEPNLPDSPGRTSTPEGFLALLKAAHAAIKAADPDALVVFPGLAPTSLMIPGYAVSDAWFLESILTLNGGEAGEYFDVLGIQGYGTGNHPDSWFPGNLADNPGWTEHPEFYFRHAEALRAIAVAAGMGDKPIWITEMGWPSGPAPDVYGYSQWVTPQTQAEYLTRAFEIMRMEWHWVEQAFIWHLNAAQFGRAPANPFAPFSLTDEDGAPRPVFHALAALMADGP